MHPTGEEIRAARLSRGLSRAQLAEQVDGVSERTIVRVERGEQVSECSIAALARHLRLGRWRTVEDAIRAASEVELIEELLRRAKEREQCDEDPPRLPAELAPPDENGYETQAARRRRPPGTLEAKSPQGVKPPSASEPINGE